MKIAAYFYIGGLFMSILACNDADHEASLPTPQSNPVSTTVISLEASSEVYPFMVQLLKKNQKAYTSPSTKVVRETALETWKAFIYRLLQSQEQWNSVDHYLQWYEANLAHSCAFTAVQQEKDSLSIHWDYNQLICHRPGIPQSGSCTLTVYQQSNTFYARFEYDQIAFDTRVITGLHIVQGTIETDGSLHIIKETLYLK
ncbi:MAG: hypothetical protein AAGE93_00710 [Bacteroidota bacterium]